MSNRLCLSVFLLPVIAMTAPAASPSAAAEGVLAGTGIQVISPPDVLREHTERAGDGTLLFRDAWGARVRLITDPEDPEVANPGNGRFHPADPSEVVAALEAIPREFLRDLEAAIYVLPYPRSGMLSSSADGRAIYLSPGVRPYERSHVHFLVAHEIGHLVHRRWLPDSDRRGWSRWAELRGTADSVRFRSDGPHAWRPREIFAEDFRVLFGGELARGDGSVENPNLVRPEEVPGLRAWYRGLLGSADGPLLAWTVSPNPLRPGASITLRPSAGAPAGDLQAVLFDLGGRRVLELVPEAIDNGAYRFPPAGRDLPSGAYWLRIEGSGKTAVVPLRVLR